MIKHVFSDMDGTILNDKGELSKGNVNAIKESGLSLTLVSARSPLKMEETINNLGVDGIHVSFNGALIFEKRNNQKIILYKEPLNFELVKKLVLDIREKFPNIGISVYDEENWNVDVINVAIAQEQRILKVEYNLVEFKKYFKIKDKEIFKVSFIEYDKNIFEKVYDYVKENYSKEKLTIQKSLHGYLEITDVVAQKSKGVEYIAQLKGLDKSEIVGFGDGENDISMLVSVRHAVVMANASAEVKKHADFITKSNNEDGVAYALENYVKDL